MYIHTDIHTYIHTDIHTQIVPTVCSGEDGVGEGEGRKWVSGEEGIGEGEGRE